MLSLQMRHPQLGKTEVGIVYLSMLCGKLCCPNMTALAAGKSSKHGVAEPSTEDTSGYAAPSMPVESVDMFSGLDLPGFALPAAELAAVSAQAAPELTQSSEQSLVQRRY